MTKKRQQDGGGEEFVEQRRTARLDVPIKVRYRILMRDPAGEGAGRPVPGEAQEGKSAALTKDISAGGCLLLVAEEELRVDDEVELQIFLGESDTEALTIRGRIVRLHSSKKGSHEYGIAFDMMSEEARRVFADYVFARMYEMIGLPDWPTDRRGK